MIFHSDEFETKNKFLSETVYPLLLCDSLAFLLRSGVFMSRLCFSEFTSWKSLPFISLSLPTGRGSCEKLFA